MEGRDERGRFLPGYCPPGNGRKTVYDETKVTAVLEAVSGGAPFRRACEEIGIRPGTFSYWVVVDYNGVAERFYAALKAKYLLELDDTVALSDSVIGSNSLPEVAAVKNACDARRFVAGRIIKEIHPQEYLRVDHARKVEVHVFLPGKPGMEALGRVVEGEVQAIEDRSEDDAE